MVIIQQKSIKSRLDKAETAVKYKYYAQRYRYIYARLRKVSAMAV